jgi:hypothetical protein
MVTFRLQRLLVGLADEIETDESKKRSIIMSESKFILTRYGRTNLLSELLLL